jgi:transcriptional regulator with XRE-family HTH domain
MTAALSSKKRASGQRRPKRTPQRVRTKRQIAFGSRMRDLRKAIGWTQIDLARELGVHPATIVRYEKGELAPPKSRIGLLAEKLLVNVEFLLTGSGSREETKPERDEHPMTFQLGPLTKNQALAAVRLYAPWWNDSAKALLDDGVSPRAIAEAMRWVGPEIAAATSSWPKARVPIASRDRIGEIILMIVRLVAEGLSPRESGSREIERSSNSAAKLEPRHTNVERDRHGVILWKGSH